MKNTLKFRQKLSRNVLTITLALLALGLAVCAQAQTFTDLSDFNGRNAYPPDSTFVQGTDGNLYNVSENGGTGAGGVAYSITPTGKMTELYNFCQVGYPICGDGVLPSSIILGQDGNFYGTTYAGTSTFSGVIFKMTPKGKQSILCTASNCSDVDGPIGIIQGSDGNLYGTTATAIFRLTSSGKLTILFSFRCGPINCPFGWGAAVPPIQGVDGNFYGTAANGALQNSGVVYEINPGGHYNVLHRFCSWANCSDGQDPTALVQDASGTIYGIAGYGGVSGNEGTLFKITPDHQFTVLHTFDASSIPQSLIIANDGNLYGTTALGGAFGGGIFQISPQGVYTVLYEFPADNVPERLMQATDGIFYGTTASGGALGYGEAFSFSNNLNPLVKTVPVAGKVGQSVLILGNNLTGTTSVTFNGVEAKFTVESDTYSKATVPTGATTGSVSVVTPTGTLNSNPQFVVTN